MEDSKSKFKLKKLIRELSKYRARHTELISVYVPAGYNLNLINQQLDNEYGTSENIKSKTTRKNVQSALKKMLQQLKLYKKLPENGLALFSGNVADNPGVMDYQIWAIEPPRPLDIKLYKCDQIFHLDPLKRMLEPKKLYGLIVIDKQGASIGYLKGASIEVVHDDTSLVPGKTRKGGQSAARFARVREGLEKDWFKNIAEVVKKEFLNNEKVTGILLGGPGPAKEEFMDYLLEPIRKKIIATESTSYTGEQGLEELVEKCKKILAEEQIAREKELVEEFFNILRTNPSHASYGKKEVEKALQMNAVELLLICEGAPEDEFEEYVEQVDREGGRWELISAGTRGGNQLSNLGNYAAILRFPIE
ncbi:MAG: peptide chain release factor 1 [Candidatus Woesearchaeota archaeon]|nr:MAG: peptide chain release factor 1 [Candidatus Woesearchaeota archaeon]